jgi:copper chaperone
MVPTTTLTCWVQGMQCGSCGLLIDDAVEDVEGVHRLETSVKAKLTTVGLDLQRCRPADVVAAIAEAGYTAHPDDP